MERRFALVVSLLLGASPLYGADRVEDHGHGVERVESYLIPVWTNSILPGAHGSQWATEVTIFNPGKSEVILDSDYANFCQVDTCAFDRLAPGEQASYDGTGAARFSPPFTWIHVKTKPAESFKGLHFNLRFKDVSRQTLSYGVELPVIREADFREEIILLSVPMQERFRQSLRIYGSIGLRNAFDVEITSPTTGELLVADELPPVYPFDYEPLGAHARVLDLSRSYPVLQLHETVRIRVAPRDGAREGFPAPRIWAFVSVTHDETNT